MDKTAIDEKRKDKIPYEHNKNLFKSFNPEKMSENTGCLYDNVNKEFIVKLMGKNYLAIYPSGEILTEDGSSVDLYPLKTLILKYLMNNKGVEPFNKNITYREVPGGNLYYRNFYGRCISRLAWTFGNKIDIFKKAFEKIGAEKVAMGDAAYRFEFLHNIFVVFVVWEGDEEFPPSSQILFDGNISTCFTAEDMAFVGDVAIWSLKKAAENI